MPNLIDDEMTEQDWEEYSREFERRYQEHYNSIHGSSPRCVSRACTVGKRVANRYYYDDNDDIGLFLPTEEEINAQEKMLAEIHSKCVEDRKNVKLIPTKDPFLYCREPFGRFLGDCTYCSNYVDPNVGFAEGGWCKLCGVDCGWGFTCKDNDSEWAIKIEF